MRRKAHALDTLRTAVGALPLRTQEAMLLGIEQNLIIVGAYTDRTGGVCPMLAAHRHGGRTSYAEFAKAWDRYTRARRARPATEKELVVLRAVLQEAMAKATLPAVNPRLPRRFPKHLRPVARVEDLKRILAHIGRRNALPVPDETGDPGRSRDRAGVTLER